MGLMLVTLAISSSVARAVPLTWRITGTVVSVTDPAGLLSLPAAAGDSFVLDYTFEPGVVDSLSSPTVGQYFGVLSSVTLAVGSSSVTRAIDPHPGPNSIVVYDDAAVVPNLPSGPNLFYDQYLVYGASDAGIATGRRTYLTAEVSFSGTAVPVWPFAGDGLPSVPPPSGPYSSNSFLWEEINVADGRLTAPFASINGIITGISDPQATVEVPEPGTLTLLGLGLAGIGLARRKRAA